jgi:hypothetical protein
MSTIEIRKFRNQYGLELIKAATSDIKVSDLVWDPVFGGPSFTHPGMPKNIFNAFVDEKLITKPEWKAFLEQLAAITFIDAEIAEQSVEVDVNFIADMEYAQLGKLGNELIVSSVKKFTFDNLQARVLTDDLRLSVDDNLEKMKEKKWRAYDMKIRRAFIISKLYYGTTKISIDKKLKEKFEAQVKKVRMPLTAGVEVGTSIEYTFSHNNVPFAMQIEKVSKFNP